MKKTAIAMLALAAGILAASCQKEAEPEFKSFGPMTINAVSEGIGTATKTEMAYKYDILWSENDQIYVTNGTSNDIFTLSYGQGTTKGTFTQDGTASITGWVQAYYPAIMVKDGGLVWPATQTNNQTVPMYSTKTVSDNVEDFNFSSLGSVLQIVFTTKTEGITVTSITLQSNKKPLSGKYTVDENGQAIMAENSENPGVTLNLGESGVPVGVAAKYFYLAIPAGTYSTPENDEVMTITFKDDVHHKECVMTFTTFPTVNRNTVGRITLAKDFTDQTFTVKFDMKGRGEAIQDANVAYGKTATAPSTPKAALSAFLYWCTDAECTTPYDFSKNVTADMTLYAKWTDGINGHAYVNLAGYKWATENVATNSVDFLAGPGWPGNEWGFYFYNQSSASGAAQSWGSEKDASQVTHTWKLPSESQWQALIEGCYWEWTGSYNYLNSPYNGMSGYIVYEARDGDKGGLNNTNSGYTPATVPHIFLPAVGINNYGNFDVTGQRQGGYYWSTDNEKCLYIVSSNRSTGKLNSITGVAVRPVSD